jgi:hypothetical protein
VLIRKLERDYDAMRDWVGRYGCVYRFFLDYPHGSSGHLFSSFAVRSLIAKIPVFDSWPGTWGEDLCTRKTIDVIHNGFGQGCSNQFVVDFPQQIVLTGPERMGACEQYLLLGGTSKIVHMPCAVTDAVTLHMHKIPMQLWKEKIGAGMKLSVMWKVKKDQHWMAFCTNE